MLIASAATQISFQPVPDFFARWIRISVDNLCCRDDHSRRAVTALQTMAFPKTFLHRMQVAVRGEAFDRSDVRSIGLHCEHRARLHRLTVDQNCAGAANR